MLSVDINHSCQLDFHVHEDGQSNSCLEYIYLFFGNAFMYINAYFLKISKSQFISLLTHLWK